MVGLVLTGLALLVSVVFNLLQIKWRNDDRAAQKRKDGEREDERRRKEEAPREFYSSCRSDTHYWKSAFAARKRFVGTRDCCEPHSRSYEDHPTLTRDGRRGLASTKHFLLRKIQSPRPIRPNQLDGK
jgi:hypothetical protein